MRETFIITIDGPAGVGKSTVSQLLAQQLNAAFLDTGAMYRAVTLAAMNKNADLANTSQILEVMEKTDFKFTIAGNVMKVALDGNDVTDDIRLRQVTANVHYIASKSQLREKLIEMQRAFANKHQRIITEGRDQGTVAFADADLKIFLTADTQERARRRHNQLAETGIEADIRELQKQIKQRDSSDMNRAIGPLKPADDAIIIDNTHSNAKEVVQNIIKHVKTNDEI